MSVLETASTPATAVPRRRRSVDLLQGLRDYGVVVGVVGLFIVLAISSDPFLTKDNLLNLVDQSAYIGLIATAGTIVVIAGGVDLSTAAIFALAGVVAAKVTMNADPWVGLLLGVVAGGAIGAANGLISELGKITSLIATLATALVIRGIAQMITHGEQVTPTKLSFANLGTGTWLDATYTAWIFVAVALVLWFVLARTRFGRHVYAVGANAEAARLSGVDITRVRTAAFVISGLAAGLAGVLSASRVGNGQSDAGTGLELQALTAVFIGGTSLSGGSGAVWRTIVGVFLLGLIKNGFDLLGWDPLYEQVIEGAIILLAVAADSWSRSGRSGRTVTA